MKINDDWLEFSSGNTAYAHGGIVGLSPEGQVTQGWDGGIAAPDGNTYDDPPDIGPADCVELADHMIKQWHAFRAKHTQEAQAQINPLEPVRDMLKAEVDRIVEAQHHTRAPQMRAALQKAETFISGFEDDTSQEGVPELLAEIRAAMVRGAG